MGSVANHVMTFQGDTVGEAWSQPNFYTTVQRALYRCCDEHYPCAGLAMYLSSRAPLYAVAKSDMEPSREALAEFFVVERSNAPLWRRSWRGAGGVVVVAARGERGGEFFLKRERVAVFLTDGLRSRRILLQIFPAVPELVLHQRLPS